VSLTCDKWVVDILLTFVAYDGGWMACIDDLFVDEIVADKHITNEMKE